MALGKSFDPLCWFGFTDGKCSDAFAGGFLAGIVGGKSLEESIDMGQWLAKLSIQELGPQYVSLKLSTHSLPPQRHAPSSFILTSPFLPFRFPFPKQTYSKA